MVIGMGWRWGFRRGGYGYPPYYPPYYPPHYPPYYPPANPEDELRYLENYKKMLRTRRRLSRKRLE